MFAFLRDRGTDGVGLAFSDRHGGCTPGSRGSLNLGRSDVDPCVVDNLERVRAALGLEGIVLVHQVHGAAVYHPGSEPDRGWSARDGVGDALPHGRALPVADAIVTSADESGSSLAIGVRVADCLPVVLADAAAGVIGVAHAGRVGLLGGVLEATLAAMAARGGRQVTAWIGPHICGQCYEVPDAMRADAARRLSATAATTSWGTPALDLAAGAEQILHHAGVPTTRVDGCTLTDENLHSHRRDGANSGRLAGLVWLG